MKYVATIEARMTSSRLPGKVMMQAAGRPMIQHLVDRLKSVDSINDIIIATTRNAEDDVIEEFSDSHDVRCYRGSEDDVMDRVLSAASSCKADVVVEITGDCPIIDPRIIQQSVQIFKHNECDYASNVIIRSYPDGMDTQVFWLDVLKRSESMTNDKLDREHVSLHIRNNPNIFKQINLIAPPDQYWPELGLTLDEYRDYNLLKKIIEHYADYNYFFSCSEVVSLLKDKLEWVSINRGIIRKGNT